MNSPNFTNTPPPTPTNPNWQYQQGNGAFQPQQQRLNQQQQIQQLQQWQMQMHQQRRASQQMVPQMQPVPRARQRQRSIATLVMPPLPQNIGQLHMSSPVIPSATLPNVKVVGPASRLHLICVGLITPKINPNDRLQERVFIIDDVLHAYLSHFKEDPATRLPVRNNLAPGSAIFRLRGIKDPFSGSDNPTFTSTWVSSETAWPKNLFLGFNDQPVDLRRKVQWGKDLAVDITNRIVPGRNILKAVCSSPGADRFAIGIEHFTCITEGEVIEIVKSHQLPAGTAKERIVKRLHPAVEDDDIIMESNSSKITLKCPMSFTPMRVPVRSKLCQHLECFDLHNYLESRPKASNGAPTCGEGYRCPICAVDARPEMLLVDGFMVQALARATAEEVQGRKGRADGVVVSKDGEWEIVWEEEEGETRESTPEMAGGKGTTGGVRRELEVICLDD